MASKFESFVILAGMRTGSNFLEENLNQFDGIHCYGEVFNPHFIGHANKKELLGVSMQDREANPIILFDKLKSGGKELPGFRFFHDHDPRIWEYCLKDKTCAKIVLFRNPVETYVSWEIARQTDQWRLNDLKNAKTAQIDFDKSSFEKHLSSRQSFHKRIQRALQETGQTAFYLGYDDLADTNVLSGIAKYLGVFQEERQVSRKTKKQNPAPLEKKVRNFPKMVSTLANMDYFGLTGMPVFEPDRGPGVPNFVASDAIPLIFMPIQSGPSESVLAWLGDFATGDDDQLVRDFTQKSLRQWKRKSKNHRSFSVVCHPVVRLYRAYVDHILLPGPMAYPQIRDALIKHYGLPELSELECGSADIDAYRTAFLRFVEFIKGNLAGQTSIRVDAAWASQAGILRAMSGVNQPDNILRESELAEGLASMAGQFSKKSPALKPQSDRAPISLNNIYNQNVEEAVRAAYQRDYMMFGFGPWRD